MEEKITRVFVSGCTGRMGKLVVEAVNNHPGWQVCGGFGRRENQYDFPVFDTDNLLIPTLFDTLRPNVIIDFSTPQLSELVYRDFSHIYSIPMVCATTKLSTRFIEFMQNQRRTPVFQAYNLAYDVYVFTKGVADMARKLPGCNIDVREIHHAGKKDSPSGTAINLANAINQALGETHIVVPNPPLDGLRKQNEIHIHSERRGSYAGTHSVTLTSGEYCVTLTHEAFSPKIFADGAIKAAEFLLTQPAGYYNMDSLASL